MATTLSYSNPDFIPTTVIKSADVNQKFNDIKSRLNWAGGTDATTGLGDDNIQSNTASGGGLTRSSKLKAGTANYVLINDSNGKVSEEAQLSSTRGGLGFAPTISSGNAGKVVGVNDAGSALELRTSEASTLIEQLANNVATLTSGQVLAVNDPVCLDLIDGQYRVMKTDSTNANRISSFLGFALNTTTATPQITTLTKAASWTSDTEIITVNGRSYSYTYATSNDASMSALAALIATDQDVQSCTVTDNGSNDNVITITSKGSLTLTITDSQTGSAPDFTIANTQTASGSSVRVQMFGPLSGFSSLTVGSLYYIASGTATIGITPLSSQVYVGQAISSTVLFVNPNRMNFSFTSSGLFVRAHGQSTPNDLTTVSSASYHYNFAAWSTGTASGVSKAQMPHGEASYIGKLISSGGSDSGGTVATTRTYNKVSWNTESAMPAAKAQAGTGELNGVHYNLKGSTNTGYSGSTNTNYSFNGSWTTNTAMTDNGAVNACYVISTKIYVAGGYNGAGVAQSFVHSWNGSSNTTETAQPYSGTNTASARATGTKGIQSKYDNSVTYTNTGSAFTSVTTMPTAVMYQDYPNVGPAGGYDSSSTLTWFNGGSTGATTAISSTYSWNGSAWTTSVSSSASLAGGGGAVL